MNINEDRPDGLDIGTDGLGDLGQIDNLEHINELGVYHIPKQVLYQQ